VGEGVSVLVRAAVGRGVGVPIPGSVVVREAVGVAVSGFELEPIRILAATGM
jgi:hypothetical protein